MDTPPLQYATAIDDARIAYMRYPGTSPVHFSVNTPGAPPLLLRATLPAYGAGYYPRFLRGKSGVYFDWRGSGSSEPVDGSVGIEDLVADLEAVTAAVGEQVDGHFSGRACFAGCLHASRHPERYRSIWIHGASVRPGENWQSLHNRPGWERNYPEHLRGLARSYFEVSLAEAARIAVLWEQGVPQRMWAAYLDAEQAVDLTAVLPQITVPTWVTASRPMDYEPAAAIAALLPDSTFSTYEPQATRPEMGDFNRAEWDRHLGARLGDTATTIGAGSSPGAAATELTRRQEEVLHLIISGASNREIAERLTLSLRTVEHHVGSIFARLNAHNRVQAVNWAHDNGFADRPTEVR
jgi:DNA-binding CsgD family transcriptional regulator